MKLSDTLLYKLPKRGIKEEKTLSDITDINNIHIIDNKTLIIENNKYIIPDSYPFGSLIINDYKMMNNNRLLSDFVEMMRGFNNKYTVLVFCHPKKILLDDKSSHFMIDVFTDTISKDQNYKGQEIVIYTVDIIAGGDFIDDGFSEKFISFHKEHFDLIFVPDCGGKWFELQNLKETQKGFLEFDDLIQRTLKMLKPNGSLLISKIISSTFKTELERKYSQFIDILYIIHTDIYNNPKDPQIKQIGQFLRINKA